MLVLFLFLGVLRPAYAQKNGYPTDGNKLLEFCGAMVDSADNPSSASSMSSDHFVERMSQFSWCAGYLEGIHDILLQNEVTIGLMGMMNMTLTGTDKQKDWAVDSLHGACIPDQVPILQLARVLVKWLREHPERLHESKRILTVAALKDAFPCTQTSPPEKETVKPTTAKP
jgi:hypothetical protein